MSLIDIILLCAISMCAFLAIFITVRHRKKIRRMRRMLWLCRMQREDKALMSRGDLKSIWPKTLWMRYMPKFNFLYFCNIL
ncbi:MAG: hypothetical protein PHO15_07520 [Eubacteriales bacterium]|nr:hypothetical protein [Eubacteriales bacterium]